MLVIAVGTLVLTEFGGGELLDIAIPTLLPLDFLLYLDCPWCDNCEHAPI